MLTGLLRSLCKLSFFRKLFFSTLLQPKQEQTLFNDLRRRIKKVLMTQKQGGSSLTMISEWGVTPPCCKEKGITPHSEIVLGDKPLYSLHVKS